MIREHHLAVTRTARYYVLGSPGPTVSQVWVVCHGYGQLAGQFLRFFDGLEPDGGLIVAPEALSRFYLDSAKSGRHAETVGASWMTREAREAEIEDYVRFLELLKQQILASLGGPVPVGVLGFSQGVATAARWVIRSAEKPQLLVLWGSGLPPELVGRVGAQGLQRTRLVFVAGAEDTYLDPAALEGQIATLRALGVSCDRVGFRGGHRLDRETLGRVLAQLGEAGPVR
ncbi:MAG: alpha/beta hydrolase [Gemmatimonadales bacterium]